MITKKVQLIHQPWSIQSTYSRQNGGIFARYCWKNDAKFSLSSFSQISTLLLKSLKRSTDVWKLQILIYCTYHIMTGIFSYHRNHIESCKNWGCQYQIIRQKAHLFKPPSDVYMQVWLWIIIRMVYKWLTAKCPMVSVYR